MSEQDLALHETMEIHELLNFKTICMTKSKMFQGLVMDKDLKSLMQKDVEQSMKAINDLQTLYTRVPTQ